MSAAHRAVLAKWPEEDPRAERLTLVRDHGHPLEVFASVEAAGVRIQELRGRRYLRVTLSMASFGAAGVQAAALWTRPAGQDTEEWLGTLVLPHAELPALKAAIHAAMDQVHGRKSA